MKLSREEFKEYMMKCTSHNVYILCTEYFSFGHDIEDAYFSLLTMFDTRISPGDARKNLMNFKITRNSNLKKAEGIIMHWASRVSSQIPEGPSRTACNDLESGTTLMRALPPASATLARDIYNKLAAKLGRAPSFIELCKALAPHAENINDDIRRNGPAPSKHTNELHENYRVEPYQRRDHDQQRSFRTYNINADYKQGVQSGPPNRNFMNNRGTGFSKTPARYQRNGNPRNNYNSNRNSGYPNPNTKTSSRGKPRLYCRKCGGSGHDSSSLCYQMINDAGNVVDTVPSFANCPKCKEVKGKDLYHPMNVCPSRDNHPKFRNNRK